MRWACVVVAVSTACWAFPATAQVVNGFEAAVREQYAEDLQRRKEEDWKKSDDAIKATQARFREEVRKTMELVRTLPVVPAARNPVLGKWMTEASQRAKPKETDFFGQMNAIANSAVCSAMFADGVVNFRPQDWAIDDFDGNDSLGPVTYRGKGQMIYVVPAVATQVIAFAVEGKDRLVAVQLSGSEPCALFRVPETTTFANRPRPGRPSMAAARAGAPGRAPSQQTFNPPTPVYAEVPRPPAEVCNRTFVDQLGKAPAQAVREAMKVRFKESQEGVTPGAQGLRLAGRGSPCDEAAIDAVWYDFDAGGLLSRVTYVWKRQAGPDIYGYLSTQTGRFATSPPRVSGGRTEGATALYRYLIEDRPQQQAVTITYTSLTP
jgi:hypothetical protein